MNENLTANTPYLILKLLKIFTRFEALQEMVSLVKGKFIEVNINPQVLLS